MSSGLKVHFGCFASRGTCYVILGHSWLTSLRKHVSTSKPSRTEANNPRYHFSLWGRLFAPGQLWLCREAERSEARSAGRGRRSAGADLCRRFGSGATRGARGAQGWARPPRVSVGWERPSSGSNRPPMKLDLDSFQLQISYLSSPIAIFQNIISRIAVNEII